MLPENFWLTLSCDLSAEAEEGPGWYVYAARHDHTGKSVVMIPLWRVTKEQAANIGNAFNDCFNGTEGHPMPSQLIESGNALIRQAIDTQLEEAEKVALRIARLRRLREAERDDEESTTS